MRVQAWGHVELYVEKCPECGRESFFDLASDNRSGKTRCCGALIVNPKIEGWQRLSVTPDRRRTVAENLQLQILRRQNYRCFYCDLNFKVVVFLKGKPVRRAVVFDHYVRWSYSQDNRRQNIVAACSLCNGIKSWLMWDTLDECKAYISKRWKDKGLSIKGDRQALPGLWDVVQS